MVKRVKRVVKMFWKRLGSDFPNSARSTTEKRTGNSSGPNPNQITCHDHRLSPGCIQPLPTSPGSPYFHLPWVSHRPTSTAQDTEAGEHEEEDGCDGHQRSSQSPSHFVEAGQDAVDSDGEGV